ncbi:hypothetical protein FACS1894124_5990 [Spirochaetia bacterium]|nr:hypothetical protein FACS1894124_5990 [Spirochaetia bacterium]
MARRTDRYSIFSTVILTAVFSILSCSNTGIFSPIDTGKEAVSSLLPVPVRREYLAKKTVFNKATDLSVMAVYPDGSIRNIPIGETTVTIKEDDTLYLAADTYPFTESGEKIVTVSYGGKFAQYAVMVLSETGGAPGEEDGIYIDMTW